MGYFGATALLEGITRSGAIKTGFIEFFCSQQLCQKFRRLPNPTKRKLGPKQQKGSRSCVTLLNMIFYRDLLVCLEIGNQSVHVWYLYDHWSLMAEQHGILTSALFVLLVSSIFSLIFWIYLYYKASTKNHSTKDHPSSHSKVWWSFSWGGLVQTNCVLLDAVPCILMEYVRTNGALVKKHGDVRRLLNISGGWGHALHEEQIFSNWEFGEFWSCEMCVHTKFSLEDSKLWGG